MRIALAQIDPTVGDVVGNTALVLDAIDAARRDAADVVLLPELALLGYPPRDLLLRHGVVEACEDAVARIARASADVAVVVGHPRRGGPGERPIRNSASICRDGRVAATYDKRLLPGYDVFDEDRYFEPGRTPLVVEIAGRRTGILICEDLWRAGDVRVVRDYAADPVRDCLDAGAEVLLALNASPFVVGKWQRHVDRLVEIARGHGVAIAAVNQVGANDDLVFDGRSLALAPGGRLLAVAPGWTEDVRTVDLADAPPADVAARAVADQAEPMREIGSALVLGLRDYVVKTGHEQVLVGLSGGIDSALTATLAVMALGPGAERGLLMPSRYSSPGSLDDARDLAGRLGLELVHEMPIRDAHDALRATLAPVLGARLEGLADENVQARLRGMLLMGTSNALGGLVLSTSNKAELATGYSTLYGDMCGAVSVIGDLSKGRVYELSRWIDDHHAECGFDRPPIPEASITKVPSAELRADQTDQDTLPPYDVLDEIVERHVESEQDLSQIVEETGFDEQLVRRTVEMIDRAQYKRDQSSVILKITPRAFGRGRPMPIVMRARLREARPVEQRLPS